MVLTNKNPPIQIYPSIETATRKIQLIFCISDYISVVAFVAGVVSVAVVVTRYLLLKQNNLQKT
jgi:hypothetical protein